MTNLAGAILGTRIAEYVRAKYGARLDGTGWDIRTGLRFLEAEAHIMLRSHDEVVPDSTLNAAIDDAYVILFESLEPEGPSATVLDLDAYRERRRT